MSDNIKPFYGAAEWNSLGRMAPPPDRDERLARTGDWRDSKGISGERAFQRAKDGQMGQYDKAEASNRPGIYSDNNEFSFYDRPYHAREFVGQKDQTLGNPYATSKMDDHTSGLSQFQHFQDIISEPGVKRLNLVKAAVRLDRKLVKEARDVGHKDFANAIIADTEPQARVIHALRMAARNQFPLPSRAQMNGPDVVTSVKDGRKTREATAKEMIALNKDIEGKTNQAIFPKADKDVDWDKLQSDFTELAAVKHSRSHTVTLADGSTKSFGGVYGIIAGKGKEGQALNAISRVPAHSIVAPSKALFSAVGGQKNQARIEKRFRDNAQHKNANRELIDSADTMIVYLDGSPKGRTWQDAGYAATQGKLGKVFDENGTEMNPKEARKILLSAYVSDAERRRAEILNGFDTKIDSREGYHALSFIHSEKEGDLPKKDYDALARTGMSISDVADAVTTEEGRSEISAQGVSAKAIRLFRDEDALAGAYEAQESVRRQMARAGVNVVWQNDFPEGTPNPPKVAYIKGSLDELRDSKATVGLIGDYIPDREENETERNIIASRSAPVISELGKQDVQRVMMEGHLPVREVAQKGDIVWFNSGHSITTSPEQRAEREEMHNRGVITISLYPPEGITVYNPVLRGQHLIPSSGNDHTSAVTARAMGGSVKELLVTNMNAKIQTSVAREAVSEFSKADRRAIFADYSDLKQIENASGNVAMTSHRGKKAFEQAGFGDDRAQRLSRNFDGARPGISTGPNAKKAVQNLASKANDREFDAVYQEQAPKARADAEMF